MIFAANLQLLFDTTKKTLKKFYRFINNLIFKIMTKQNLNGGAGNQVAATAMVFENPEFGKIRTLTDAKGEPLFCGKDVCEVLGYKNPSDAVRQHVEEDDLAKCEVWVATGKKADGTVAQKRMQMLFINESGFYGLMFGSQQQAAKRFSHWVTAEVLPLIRKNGCYMLRKQLKKKDMLIGKQAINILALRCDVKRLTPKANYADNVLNSISCYTTTQIAKELGCTAQELNRSLCEMHVQYYQSGNTCSMLTWRTRDWRRAAPTSTWALALMHAPSRSMALFASAPILIWYGQRRAENSSTTCMGHASISPAKNGLGSWK